MCSVIPLLSINSSPVNVCIHKWMSEQNKLWSPWWTSGWNLLLQVQSLWVCNFSSAHYEASSCLSGLLQCSEDSIPPWWLCRNIVHSSKQYFSHSIVLCACEYAHRCVCIFSTKGVWLDWSHPQHVIVFPVLCTRWMLFRKKCD